MAMVDEKIYSKDVITFLMVNFTICTGAKVIVCSIEEWNTVLQEACERSVILCTQYQPI